MTARPAAYDRVRIIKLCSMGMTRESERWGTITAVEEIVVYGSPFSVPYAHIVYDDGKVGREYAGDMFRSENGLHFERTC